MENRTVNVAEDCALTRLITNSRRAMDNCVENRSEWGAQYWSNVLAHLLRQGQRLS